jgi:hypothetical protein
MLINLYYLQQLLSYLKGHKLDPQHVEACYIYFFVLASTCPVLVTFLLSRFYISDACCLHNFVIKWHRQGILKTYTFHGYECFCKVVSRAMIIVAQALQVQKSGV